MTAPPKDAAAAEPISKDRLRLWLTLLRTSKQIEEDLRRRLRSACNTTLPRFDVMSALARVPDGLKMGEISRQLRVSNGNITGIVDTLTQEGLALRLAVPGDRRANLVRLTPRGQSVFAEQAAAYEAWINEILGGLGADDIDGMMRRLAYLGDQLEKPG